MEFDDVFKYVGEFGLYQFCLYLSTGLTVFYAGWQHLGMAILGAKVDHWCEVDGIQDYPYEAQKEAAIPYNKNDEEYYQCEAYDRNFTGYSEEDICYGDFSNYSTVIKTCNSWVYDRTVFLENPVSKFDLVCDDEILIAVSSTMYLFGILIGSVLSGVLSDKLGRFPVLVGGSILHLVFGIAAAYGQTYWSFSTLRLCVGIFVHGTYNCALIILLESTGPKYRALAGCLFTLNFSYGYMLLPVMAYFVRDYSKLMLCMALPVIASLFYVTHIYESPRWLITRGRFQEAREIVTLIGEVNGKPLPDKCEFSEIKQERVDFLQIFKYPVLRREMIIMCFCWFTNSLVYYGLGLSAGVIADNIFLSIFIGALVEIPGQIVAIFLFYYIGRRPMFGGCFLIAGAACVISIFIISNEDLVIVVLTLVAITKATIKITFTLGYIYTAEIFPTPVRHTAVGTASMMSRFGGLFAPFITPLFDVWAPLPSIICGTVSIISGVLAFFLPETLGKELPDTIEAAIRLADKHYYPGISIEITAETGEASAEPPNSSRATDGPIKCNGFILSQNDATGIDARNGTPPNYSDVKNQTSDFLDVIYQSEQMTKF